MNGAFNRHIVHLRTLGLLALAAALETAATWLCWSNVGAIDLILAGVAHLAGSTAAAEALLCAPKWRRKASIAVPRGVAYFIALMCPLLGTLGCALIALYPGRQGLMSDDIVGLESRRVAAAAQIAERKRRFQRIAEVTSIVDALAAPTLELRFAGLDALRDVPAPQAARILKRARENSARDIRAQAVERLGRMAREAATRLAEAQKDWRTTKDNSVHASAVAKYALELAELGTEAPERAQALAELAVECAGTQLRSNYDRASALILGAALRFLGHQSAAGRAYCQILETEGFIESALVGLLETLLAARDFPSLQGTCRAALATNANFSSRLRQQMETWVSGEAIHA